VASVTQDSIHLKYYVDNSAYIPEVSLQRSIDGLNYIEITKLPVTGTDLEYYDSEVDVYNESYTYRVQIIDSCGNPGAYSNRAKSILLNVQTGDVERINYLSWNPYSEFDGSILAYRIYRGLSGQPANTFIGTVPNGFYSYEDDVNNVISNGQICYRVEAVESMNVYSFSETASSNEACALLEPIIYIPNSFTPNDDEHNPIFLPILSDFDASDFQLLIFNRWGKQIFETNQYDEGWDGTIALSGKLAPVGTYLYVVTVKDGEGNEIVKQGHVNLVK
jgi:gliding motility-associated-like protein